MNLNEIKQEASGTHDSLLELLEDDVPIIKSDCKLESTSSITLEAVESDENILVKQELLHEELDIKSEDETVLDQGNQPCELKKLLKCNICGHSTSNKRHIKEHLRTHTGEKPFKCTICEYSTAYKSHLYRHLRTHSEEKPFECNICDSNFRLPNDLKTHLRIHTGEKPFKCNLCNYRCNQNSALKSHLRTHTGEKPFKCNVCSKTFSVKNNLKRHIMITHSGEKSC